MAWVIGTSVILDLLLPDSPWRTASAACLQKHLAEGLCICPVTFVELGPAFGGTPRIARAFFQAIPITTSEPWTIFDTEMAHRLWYEHQLHRRSFRIPKRPVADILIASFAARFQGIITRNAADFRKIAPTLTIIEP